MCDVTPYPQRFMSLMKNFVCGECGALENPGPVFSDSEGETYYSTSFLPLSTTGDNWFITLFTNYF